LNTKLLCHNAAILIAVTLLLSAGPGCGEADNGDAPYDIETLEPGERPLVTLPFEFDIVPSNTFYVDGVLIEHAVLTTEEGGSLYLNGVPVLPHRPCPPPPPHTEEFYERIFGEAPFVQERMASGASATEAATRYIALRESISGGLGEIYRAARESGASKQAAGEEAFARLKDLDPLGLIDWEAEVRQKENYVVVTWKGEDHKFTINIVDPRPIEEPKMPNEMAKRRLATRFYELLGRGGAPCWYVITCGSTTVAVGKDKAAEMEAHLQEVLSTGVATHGALPRRAAREILEQALANDGR
jgi:hypothetical protein